MSPSTKERLRKNLETFGSDRTSVFLQEIFKADGPPPPITNFTLPDHTKNAYRYATQSSMSKRRMSTIQSGGVSVAKPVVK